jgi:hypothetical protein
MFRIAQNRPRGTATEDDVGPLEEETAPRPSLRQLLVPVREADTRSALASAPAETEACRPAADANWPAAIEMIRDVGARIRQARRYAQDVVAHSQGVVEATVRQLEDTERRLRLAEAAAQDALLRAQQAETALKMADARARRAEEEAETTRAKLAEAQIWLRRLYSSVHVEFRELTDDRR